MFTVRKPLLALAALVVVVTPATSTSASRRSAPRATQASAHLAGLGPSLGTPADIAVDSTGALTIIDLGGSAAISIDPVTGNRTILSDNRHGSGPQLQESFPSDARKDLLIVVDGTGTRLVVGNRRVVRIDPATGNRTILTDAGYGGFGTGPFFFSAQGAAVEAAGSVLIVIGFEGGVVRIDLGTGNRTLISGCDRFGSSCVPVGSGPTLVNPVGAVLGEDGALFLANGQDVVRVDPVTGDRTIAVSGTTGTGPALPPATALAREASGDFIWASVLGLFRVDAVSGDRALLSGVEAGAGVPFRWISAVAVEPTGSLAVTDSDLAAVVRVDPTSGDRTVLSGGPIGSGPRITACVRGAAREPSGTIVIANCDQGLIRVDPATGNRSIVSGLGVGSGPAFLDPFDVAAEASGTLLVADGLSLKRVHPQTGARTVVADRSTGSPFLDATSVVVEPGGTALVMDAGFTAYIPVGLGFPVQTRAALRRVDVGTGSSEVLSGGGLLSGDVGRGPLFYAPVTTIARDPREGTAAIVVYNDLYEVDLATGNRRFVNRAQTHPNPVRTGEDIAVAPDGSWLVEMLGGSLVRVDPATGAPTWLSSPIRGSGPMLGYAYAMVPEPGGTVLVVFARRVLYGSPEPLVLLMRIDTATGDRTVLSRY